MSASTLGYKPLSKSLFKNEKHQAFTVEKTKTVHIHKTKTKTKTKTLFHCILEASHEDLPSFSPLIGTSGATGKSSNLLGFFFPSFRNVCASKKKKNKRQQK